MKLAALCSGGKDSTLALRLAMEEGHQVTKIVAMIPDRDDSWMYHFPNIRLIDLFSDCLDIPVVKAETSGGPEQEVEDLRKVLEKLKVDGVVSGAIASKYQKSRIDGVCKKLRLKSLSPLWGKDPVQLLNEILASGTKVIVTAVAAEGLDERWLGRELNEKAVGDLMILADKYSVNPSGEGGEYETLVLDAPFFKSKITVVEAEKIWSGSRGHYLIKRAAVEDKT
jgi:ABC transporter with metal-binding/Fe-S-binding domain ATP-binding protein